MRQLERIRRWMTVAALALATTPVLAQEQPAARPESAEPRAPAGPPPTEAESSARLQRSIDKSARQAEALTATQNDPQSEFQRAERALGELDRQLAELRRALESDAAAGAARGAGARRAGLEPKHKLTKERFDLAIRERKTPQEQITTLSQKVRRDAEVQRMRFLGVRNEIEVRGTGAANPLASE